MSVLQEGEALVMMRKKSKDTASLQAFLWVAAALFAVAALMMEEVWIFLWLGVPFIITSVVYALCRRYRVLVVHEEGIESMSFFTGRRTVPWERVVSYREKIKRGEYHIDCSWKNHVAGVDNSGWTEDSFRLRLTLSEGRPLYVSNEFTEYKRFKKLLREKGIPREEKSEKAIPSVPKNDSAQEFKAQVQELAAPYAETLAQRGVELRVSKRYFEMPVTERMISGIRGEIDRAKARKREKENGYHHQRNTYYCLIVSLVPADGGVRKDRCKDYAFVLRKRERGYIGDPPVESAAEGEKLLAKIERRIQKICRKAEKHTAQKVCTDTLWDALRYVCSAKYAYKDPILGKDRTWFELGLILGIAVLIFAVAICGEIIWS